MSTPRSLSIYYRFLIPLIAISVVPLLLLGIGIAHMDRRVLIEHSAMDLSSMAGIVASELHLTLNDILRDSRVMASIPSIKSMESDVQKNLLENLFLTNYQYSILSISDSHGEAITSVPEERCLTLNPHLIQKTLGQDLQSWFVTPFFTDSQRFFTVYTPIQNRTQQVAGVLVSAVNLVDLVASVKRIKAGRSQAFVVDRAGYILIHPEQEKMEYQETGPWLESLLQKKMVGTGTIYYKIDGEQYDVGYASLTEYDWIVLVQRPDIEVAAAGQKAYTFTILVLVLTTLMVFIALSWLLSQLTNPIRELAKLSLAFADGDVSIPLPRHSTSKDEIGSLITAFGDMRNIVKKRTEELRENQEKFKALFDTVEDAIFIYNAETFEILDANAGTSRIYGYSREELIGMSCLQFSADEDESKRVSQQIEEGGAASGPIHHHKSKDGSALTVYLTGYKIMINGKELLFAVGRDITNQVKAEKENEALQEQLKHVQKLESIGQLAGGIAHDFNNQLAGILGYADLLVQSLKDEKLKQYARRIQQGAHNGANLTQQLLSFARKGQYVLEVFDLNEILDEVVGILTHTIDKRIQVELKKNVGSPTIRGDYNQIQNAFLNISLNARDAIDGSGCILIESTEVDIKEEVQGRPLDLNPGSYIRIRISDDGSGMDQSTQQRIFEPFFTTKGIGEGTGMGLPAAYGTIKHHGGGLNVESTPGKGSDFYVYLPFYKAEKKEMKVHSSIIEASHASGILIVDDDEIIRVMLSEVLESLGYTVFSAGDGVIGLQKYRENHFMIDLVILDMIMPNKGGEELYHALKIESPQLKILISSGYSLEESSISRIIDDETLFLQKPYTIKDISRIVSEMLG